MTARKVDIAIVGAGLAGLMAGRRLMESGLSVAIFESAPVVGGRIMTDSVGKGRADSGAQFFTVREPEFAIIVAQWLRDGVVFEWTRGWSDDSLGDSIADGYPRYAARDGFAALAEYLASDLPIYRSCPVESLSVQDGKWIVADPNPSSMVQARAALLCLPVPEALSISAKGGVVLPEEERRALAAIRYGRCLCGLFEIEGGDELPFPGAVQQPDQAITWVADNLRKGVSANSRAITAHVGLAASEAYWSADDEEVLAWIWKEIGEWFSAATRITDARLVRWPYAVPLSTYPGRYLLGALAPLLAFAGDAFNGPRVEGAVLSGLAAAGALLASLR